MSLTDDVGTKPKKLPKKLPKAAQGRFFELLSSVHFRFQVLKFSICESHWLPGRQMLAQRG